MRLSTRVRSLQSALLAPVDSASLVFFRVMFGLIMLWEVYRYFDQNRVVRYYIEPEFYFTYYGFGWLAPLPGNWMIVHFVVLGILAVMIMMGLFYRVATVLFFFAFTYVFLLDQTQYLNHFYLVSLISFLMIFVPAHRSFSLDALIWKDRATDEAPAWALWILRLELAIVYFYAGLSKWNVDWLERGEPLRSWMAGNADLPLIGPFMMEEWMVWLFVYGGFTLDLLIAPALLWRRTRLPAFVIVTFFHLMNAVMFNIGIFPWFMIVATTLFFEPNWIRKVSVKLFGPTLQKKRFLRTSSPIVLPILGFFLLFQIFFPLRHILYPGDVNWTEEGHRFSWRMKLRDKSSESLVFIVTHPETREEIVADPTHFLNDRQLDKMSVRPDMILQFAHYLAEDYEREIGVRPEVRVHSLVSLNRREVQEMIDPTVDLAAQPRTLGHVEWIKPLQ
jgi:hypothetical protein